MSTASTSLIIYIVVGVVVLLLIGVATFLWLRNRRHSPSSDLPVHVKSSERQSTNDFHAHASPVAQNAPVAPDQTPPNHYNAAHQAERTHEAPLDAADRALAEIQADPHLVNLQIRYSSIFYTRVLSKGGFGEVWLAHYDNRQVAVKRIRNEKRNDENEMAFFAAEIKLMALLQHPKIVHFVGVSWNLKKELCAVTEYMRHGDLFDYLTKHTGKLTWREHKTYLAEDIAEALRYLHGLHPMVVHRDLKSKNILLDDTHRAKLSDFGISRQRFNQETMTSGVGTVWWTAPEVLTGKKYSEKADIYSFGIVLTELDTHQVPYASIRENGRPLKAQTMVEHILKRHLRPQLTKECPKDIQHLVVRCLDADPKERPDAGELLRLIWDIQTAL